MLAAAEVRERWSEAEEVGELVPLRPLTTRKEACRSWCGRPLAGRHLEGQGRDGDPNPEVENGERSAEAKRVDATATSSSPA